MPRTIQEVIAQADELARRFENGELPGKNAKELDAAPLREVRKVFEDAARTQERLVDAVSVARASGHTWAMIGAMVGTSGEAARQRYGSISAARTIKRRVS